MTRSIFIAAALALAVTLPAVPANAQTAIRTYVSISGSDTNPCSLTAPCRHFSAAVALTSAGGEVDALDPGGYGSFTINQAITIEGQGWSYVAPPNGGAGITITASSGIVSVRGVSLNGVGATGSTNGINYTGGGTLNVQNSVFRNFTNAGILFQPNAASEVFVSDTLLADNGYAGLYVFTYSSNPYNVSGALDHVRAENNGTFGLGINTSASASTISISNSVVANTFGSGSCGIAAEGGGATAISTVNVSDSTIEDNYYGVCIYVSGALILRSSTIAGSTNAGIYSAGSGVAWVTRSTINGNNPGIGLFDGGTAYSFGDNNLFGNGPNGNGADNGSFTSTQQYK
jgi:hypothetical protein